MPLIPYPNVPQLPGVPALNRSNNAQFVGGALNVVGQILPDSLFSTKWEILDENDKKLITPDSVVSFSYKEERRIPTYPIENGGFQSYNKVAVPFDIQITVTCSGSKGKMKKSDFLNAINKALDSVELLTIATPDRSYQDCNLIHVDYRRESNRGAQLIIAQLFFQQVRVVSREKKKTTQPSGSEKTFLGELTTTVKDFFGSFKPSSAGIGSFK